MHQTAVILLCALIAYFVWRDSVELFIAWYSGVESPSARFKVWVWTRAVLGVGAAAIAIATL
jgi:hypothetical protein